MKKNSQPLRLRSATLHYGAGAGKNPWSVYTLYFILPSSRVKTYYRTVNNIKDTILVQYDYIDTFAVVSIYRINWGTNARKLLQQLTINSPSSTLRSSTTMGRFMSPKIIQGQSDVMANVFSAVFIATGDWFVWSVGAAVFVSAPVSGVIIGIGGLYVMYVGESSLYQLHADQLNALLNTALSTFSSLAQLVLNSLPDWFSQSPNPQNANLPQFVPISIMISNPSLFPVLHSGSNGGCYGTVDCSFFCTSNYWDATTNTLYMKDENGSLEKINGVLYSSVTSNWGAPSTFINANNGGAQTLVFSNVKTSNGIVTGDVSILGDFGDCNPAGNSSSYITSFNVELINTTLGSVSTYSNITGTYQIGSNIITGHQ